MRLRFLSGLLLATLAQAASAEVSIDGIAFLLPEPYSMVTLDRGSEYFLDRTEDLSPTQVLAIYHEHRGNDLVELVVALSSTQQKGEVTTPTGFRLLQLQEAEDIQRSGDRYLLHRAENPGELFTIVQANGKLLTCFLFHFREDGDDREALRPSAEDERKLLVFTQALIAANPPLTANQSSEINTAIGLMIALFLIVVFLIVAYFRSLKRPVSSTPPPLNAPPGR